MEQIKQYLKGTSYNVVNATSFSIHEIQDCLRQCRVDDNLVIYVEKCDESRGFFDRLCYFKLDTQDSNYYLAHSRNYAVWIESSELNKEDLLSFLHTSRSLVSVDEHFFDQYPSYGNKTERVV